MRSSSQPRGRTGGNSVVVWYARSSTVGHPHSWPCVSHHENDIGSRGATLWSSSTRIIITVASSTYRSHASRADPPGSRRAESVRAGSIACHTAARVDR